MISAYSPHARFQFTPAISTHSPARFSWLAVFSALLFRKLTPVKNIDMQGRSQTKRNSQVP
ncbi:MAG: hypothetical protein A2428_11465 [Bdellovibrionales bacterium RIFOXYC1_FULL_54_43]|nr:MAG: hypothetical protein A2428_11465 [Bdellovibrionales bacterium RIFOXYC1_FULL_54_43]